MKTAPIIIVGSNTSEQLTAEFRAKFFLTDSLENAFTTDALTNNISVKQASEKEATDKSTSLQCSFPANHTKYADIRFIQQYQ